MQYRTSVCAFCRKDVQPRKESEFNYVGSYTHTFDGRKYNVCWDCFFSPRYPELVQNWEARKNYVRRSERDLRSWELEMLRDANSAAIATWAIGDRVAKALDDWKAIQESNPFY